MFLPRGSIPTSKTSGAHRRTALLAAALVLLAGAGCGLNHPQLIYENARRAESQKKLSSAKLLYEQVIAQDPGHLDALENYGFLLMKLDDRKTATDVFQRVLRLDPERSRSAAALGEIYLGSRRTQAVEDLLNPWRGVRRPPAEIRFLQADLAIRNQRPEEAIAILGLLGRDGTSVNANRAKTKLASLAARSGKVSEAEKLFKEVIASDSANTSALVGLGNVALAAGRFKQAEDYFSRAWNEPSKPSLAGVGLVVCAVRQGDLGKATHMAGDLTSRYPSELNYAVMLAELAVASDQKEVLASLELPDAAGSIKQYVEGLRHLASAQYHDAYPVLTSVAREWSDYGPAQLFASQVALRVGDRIEAFEFLKSAEKNLPQRSEISALVARTALDQSHSDLALEQLPGITSEDAASAAIRVEIAFRQGDYPAALVETEKWIAADPDTDWARASVGDILYASGKLDEARRAWEAVAENGKDASSWAKFRLAVDSRDWKVALTELDQLEGVVSSSKLSLLKGQIEMVRGDSDRARTLFDAAALDNPQNSSARSWSGVWKIFNRQVNLGQVDLDRALEINPSDPIGLWASGCIAMLEKRYADAQSLFEQSLKTAPVFDMSRLMLAEALLAQGKQGEALEQAGRLGPEVAGSLPVLDLRGRAQILSGKWVDALKTWNVYKSRAPKSPVAFFYIAQVEFLRGHPKQAEDAIRDGLKVASQDAGLQLARAELLWERAKKVEALAMVADLAKGGKNDEAELYEGVLHLKEKHFSKASSVFRDLLSERPDDPRLYSLLYESQVGLEKPDEGVTAIRTGWLRLPKTSGLGFQLAAIQEQGGNWQEAESVYREILKVDPKNVRALNQAAWAIAKQGGDMDEALKLAEEACALAPDNPAAADTRAWILYLRKDTAGSRKALDALIREVPENPYVWYHFGLVLAQTGDKPGAKAAFQKAVELKADFSEAADAHERIKSL